MSKRAQQNQSAFNVGKKIGLNLAKTLGKIKIQEFNRLFKTLYTGNRAFYLVAYRAAKIGYANGLDKAAKTAIPEPLTGEQHAKL